MITIVNNALYVEAGCDDVIAWALLLFVSIISFIRRNSVINCLLPNRTQIIV